ncbi:hypothetical protein CC78DRAFT_580018 [Lojkania enalia]|uniref:Ecp2 effector protein domain-containing protein n=1 Tax=Lojkania enalia TaxID=147567 RepID=A0A9P4N3T6_9PLEO|nr:hypothetical protein CC78DRAFT_580018 [Didymosphaeria enalia]
MKPPTLFVWAFTLLSDRARSYPVLTDTVLDDATVNLTKRASYPPMADDEWQRAVNEGRNLLGACWTGDSLAVTYFPNAVGTIQSSFVNNPQDIRDWGYTRNSEADQDFMCWAMPDLWSAMQALGVNYQHYTNGGNCYVFGWRHSQQTTHNNIDYPPTRAIFDTIINVNDGLIVGWQKFGPKYQGSLQNPPIMTLPELKGWGDVVFLDWIRRARLSNRSPENLNYIVSADCVNRRTGETLQRITGETDMKASCTAGRYKWAQRLEFGMDTQQGQALLSSPNGRGAALLLIRHKDTFGRRSTISRVAFFCGGSSEVHLLFWVHRQN